ncbi:hypothetical protein M569_17656 [Genlisea aurea]|uniref:Uncharacterized protein n=1 Tax=Genlisea aurea TaxID=192259 RepID=S8BRB0_9LAMI|nr:hypothetical protein M569_17656 [Genlisea aurea]
MRKIPSWFQVHKTRGRDIEGMGPASGFQRNNAMGMNARNASCVHHVCEKWNPRGFSFDTEA